MKGHSLLSFTLLLLLVACKHQVATDKPVKSDTQAFALPPQPANTGLKPVPGGHPYRPSETKFFDLVHTQLDVDFDWQKERMNGKAVLTLRPWFEPQAQVVLDAKGFLIHDIALATEGNGKKLKYAYDNEKLTVTLDRTYTREESLKIAIRYTARPSELDSLVSETAAGDHGLYFVNARGEQPGKPRQAWTQGESHGSPGWFPTFDSPNQRCTADIAITVADSLETLSNGLLVRSEPKPRGMRTDHWVMDKPHAPYLFMMAVGNYAVVKDRWRDREVSYYVEPKYEPYARLIFGHTPEMMEFFSTRLGVEYPWQKYAQVVVRDFVSGAMENTSATTHFERLQHDARQHLDNSYEDIVSHELFHQWFGDLVTCESWANLSLNEGFATYGEYLWIEYKYGHDDATVHLLDDRRAYLRSAMRGKFPIIRYHHMEADDLFDAHSYQKGGQVLHMLRKLVGDDAFFASLKRYLTANAYEDVEIHELRLAFEEVTGQDLNWFFDQWYLAAGHPVLEVAHTYADGNYTLQLRQIQNLEQSPVFRLPVTVEIVTKGKLERMQVWMQTADTTFAFPVSQQPDYVVVDPEKDLLLEIKAESPPQRDAWLKQAVTAKGYARKAAALEALDLAALSDSAFSQVMTLAGDPFWATRASLLEEVGNGTLGDRPEAQQMGIRFLGDPHPQIRIGAALFLHSHLGNLSPELTAAAAAALLKGIQDSSYTVSQFSLETYYALVPAEGLARTKQLMAQPEPHLIGMIAKILKESQSPEALPFIQQNLADPVTETGAKISMLRGMGNFLNQRPEDEKQLGMGMLMKVVQEKGPRWLRFTALQSLSEMEVTGEIRQFFEARGKLEDDQMILTLIKRYLESN